VRASTANGDSASMRAPRRVAAARRLACWPRGRSDSTVQPCRDSDDGVDGRIAPAWHSARARGRAGAKHNYNGAMTSPPNPLDALAAHFAGMPPVAALNPAIDGWGDGHLRLSAPLAANINDKGCAFGGSLVSLMTIAAWGLVFLELAQAGIEADIYVADSRVRYLKPVFEDLAVDAGFDHAGERAALVDTLRKQGRASIRLKSEALLADGGVAASFVGRYVAIRRDG
jgi:thioesterase domain-containing protein